MSETDSRLVDLVRVLQELRKHVAGTQLDIADRAKFLGGGMSLSPSTISDLLRGKLRDGKSGPNVLLMVDAMVDLSGHSAHAISLAKQARDLLTDLTSPAPRWTATGAEHFAQLEFAWGGANVFPGSSGSRLAVAVSCMGATQRPFRQEVFTQSMRQAVLRGLDWGPLRPDGSSFQPYVTPTETGFRAWGTITAWNSTRFVAMHVSAFGAVSAYWFGPAVVQDDEPFSTPEYAALCSLVAVHGLLGSTGEAFMCSIKDAHTRVGRLVLPRVPAEEQFTGRGWPEGVVQGAEVEASEREADLAPEDSLTHAADKKFRQFGASHMSSGPLETYGRRLPRL